jgi:hypothetical protein
MDVENVVAVGTVYVLVEYPQSMKRKHPYTRVVDVA